MLTKMVHLPVIILGMKCKTRGGPLNFHRLRLDAFFCPHISRSTNDVITRRARSFGMSAWRILLFCSRLLSAESTEHSLLLAISLHYTLLLLLLLSICHLLNNRFINVDVFSPSFWNHNRTIWWKKTWLY